MMQINVLTLTFSNKYLERKLFNKKVEVLFYKIAKIRT